MRETIKTGLRGLFEALLDTIEAFSDYFIFQKRVTLSEACLFWFSFAWTLWFICVGVYVSDSVMSRAAWTTVFMTSTTAHFFAFFAKGTKPRAYVISGYAVIWCFLTLLSLYTGSTAPAAPSLGVLTIMGVAVAVRLFREGPSCE